MVLRATGSNWLTLMMRAERERRGSTIPDSDWLLYGPTDPDAVAAEDTVDHDQGPPEQLLAAE